jgi:type I restriction enzyme M protein
MLTADTKRRIDSARQVLVGQLPNPFSQIQEITNALIYKFMDDMDEQAAVLGGKRRYFTGDFEKYSWRQIMSAKVGAQERLNLYQEALRKMQNNPGLPPMFQKVFQNAYLPFNDPRTLTLFLNEINYFDYKHSEELGNAYEYLLSIMGSQGDAGQFRTPRHIIDFIVKAVNPTKNDKILDPACGTAGFLISSYKHIMSQHDGKDDISGENTNTEAALSADEKKQLYDNFTGFDIDSGMVKLSQVNMFLHGFIKPKIIAHDSLSSEDYWQDRYDVILANPPFMTPKGGIVPHNKFSVKSNRAEVLFVDYIMNHLKPKGRAGVIVPEGIIFQSGTAYKQLRKNLVEDGIFCVVSLPSGVFNPYAGVKTSILLFDNEIAKTKKELLFIKIAKDGYDLGAQRRRLSNKQVIEPEWDPDVSDLPQALEAIRSWSEEAETLPAIATTADKDKIADDGDYNLSGDRYRLEKDYTNIKWPLVKLSDICNFVGKGGRPASFASEKGKIPFIVSSSKEKTCESADFDMEALVIGDGGSANIHYINGRFSASDHTYVLTNKTVATSLSYVYNIILNNLELIEKGFQGQGLKNVSKKHLELIEIPVPPIEVQKEIVQELDGYQKIIDAAQTIVETYKPTIKINPDWDSVKLADATVKITDGSHNPPKASESEDAMPMLSSRNISGGKISFEQARMLSIKDFQKEDKRTNVQPGDVLLTIVGALGRSAVVPKDIKKFTLQRSVAVLKPEQKKILPMFLKFLLDSPSIQQYITNNAQGVAQKGIYLKQVGEMKIPLPPIEIQHGIVADLEAEQKLIDANKKLIEIYQKKIKDKLSEIWGE